MYVTRFPILVKCEILQPRAASSSALAKEISSKFCIKLNHRPHPNSDSKYDERGEEQNYVKCEIVAKDIRKSHQIIIG
jgi:hypothetical protein